MYLDFMHYCTVKSHSTVAWYLTRFLNGSIDSVCNAFTVVIQTKSAALRMQTSETLPGFAFKNLCQSKIKNYKEHNLIKFTSEF